MEKVRTFIGIPVGLSPQLITMTEDLMANFSNSDWIIKWVGREQMHVTLRFLGEIESGMVPDISSALENGLKGFEKLAIYATRIGFFGSKKAPRVLWIGLDGHDHFNNLKRKVDASLSGIIPDERVAPFTPHVTLGRVKGAGDPRYFAEVMRNYREPFRLEVKADSIVFFRSDLQRSGPVYTPIAVIR